MASLQIVGFIGMILPGQRYAAGFDRIADTWPVVNLSAGHWTVLSSTDESYIKPLLLKIITLLESQQK
jgi:hypothetical protein